MKRSLRAFAFAVFLMSCMAPSAGPFVPHVALAQTDCSGLESEREGAIRDLNEGTRSAIFRMQRERSAMKTTDSSVADQRLSKAMKELAAARKTYGEDSPIVKLAQDQVDFWQAKRSELALGTSVGGGDAYVELVNKNIKKLQTREAAEREHIAQLEREIAHCKGQSQPETSGCASITGTWHWWNGLTVTFSPGGGATYRGNASGSGSWQKTGSNSYHAHWNAGNTDDYFVLSHDGKKIEGTFDGKPGASTRNC
jgi:hypothetical protein